MPRALKNFTLYLLALMLGLAAVALFLHLRPQRVRVLTFNIEDYPRSARQEVGAFAAIALSRAPVAAVQEITDPPAFARAAKRRLGESWRFVATDDGAGRHQVGVLFDSEELELLSHRTRRELQVYAGARPALEARLKRSGGSALRLLVVHLAAGSEGAERRKLQLAALRPVLRELVESGDQVVALGDFNATGDSDRAGLDALARETSLTWSTRELPCTAWWSRDDGCVGSALDHALTSVPAHAEALGPCLTEGCALRPACPDFCEQVSDHCPVVLDW